MTLADHLLYGALWASFGVLHSILASARVKQAAPDSVAHLYRLLYNGFAGLHIGLVWGIGEYVIGAGSAVLIGPPWEWLRWIGALAGVILLFAAFRRYDTALFLGLRQVRERGADDDDEGLVTGGLQRYMRHPLYTGAMIILWCRAATEVQFATAAWASLYFWIGSRYEERRLIARYGAAYEAYRAATPAFIPWGIWRAVIPGASPRR